jgi:hypothetical protein
MPDTTPADAVRANTTPADTGTGGQVSIADSSSMIVATIALPGCESAQLGPQNSTRFEAKVMLCLQGAGGDCACVRPARG